MYPFTVAFAAMLTFIGINWHRITKPSGSPWYALGRSALVGWLTIFVPYTLLWRSHPDVWRLVLAAPVWLIVGGLLFTIVIPAGRRRVETEFPWWTQAVIGFASSAVSLFALSDRFWAMFAGA